jgi:hypothetical protein
MHLHSRFWLTITFDLKDSSKTASPCSPCLSASTDNSHSSSYLTPILIFSSLYYSSASTNFSDKKFYPVFLSINRLFPFSLKKLNLILFSYISLKLCNNTFNPQLSCMYVLYACTVCVYFIPLETTFCFISLKIKYRSSESNTLPLYYSVWFFL